MMSVRTGNGETQPILALARTTLFVSEKGGITAKGMLELLMMSVFILQDFQILKCRNL